MGQCHLRYSLAGQDTRPSPERPGFESPDGGKRCYKCSFHQNKCSKQTSSSYTVKMDSHNGLPRVKWAVFQKMLHKCLLRSKTVWPSVLRRWLKAPFRKGVGSNPTAVTFKLPQNAFYKRILHHAKPDAGLTPPRCVFLSRQQNFPSSSSTNSFLTSMTVKHRVSGDAGQVRHIKAGL